MRLIALAACLIATTAIAQDGPPKLVVGGQPAPQGAWPDVAGVYLNGQYVACTGTLIAPNLVVTADHCVDPFYTQGARATHVVLDETNWWQTDQPKLPVAEVIRHRSADIALLVLQDDVQDITPRAIADGCIIDRYLTEGAPVEIVGYGLTSANSQFNTTLMQGTTEVVSPDCAESFQYQCDQSLDSGSELYAGGDGVDACQGDSGGPLFLLTELGAYLVGVTSRGPEGCRHGAIWVRPDAFVDWMQEESGIDIPLATCNAPPELSEDFLTVPQGKRQRTRLSVTDPEGDTTFAWSLVVAPEHGTIEIDDDGKITFTADKDYLGDDSFTVQVTDTTGFPSQSAQARVGVEIVKPGLLGCSCSSSATPASAAWLLGLGGLIGLIRRRGQTASFTH